MQESVLRGYLIAKERRKRYEDDLAMITDRASSPPSSLPPHFGGGNGVEDKIIYCCTVADKLAVLIAKAKEEESKQYVFISSLEDKLSTLQIRMAFHYLYIFGYDIANVASKMHISVQRVYRIRDCIRKELNISSEND